MLKVVATRFATIVMLRDTFPNVVLSHIQVSIQGQVDLIPPLNPEPARCHFRPPSDIVGLTVSPTMKAGHVIQTVVLPLLWVPPSGRVQER